MLLKLDNSLAESIVAHDENADNVIIALDNIAAARRNGKHLLFGSRETLKVFCECAELSNGARTIFKRVYERLPQKGAYVESLARQVNVVATAGALTARTEGPKTEIDVSAHYFVDTSMADRTVLLCENPDDGAFYRFLTLMYLKNNSSSNIAIEFEVRHGGGSTLARVYEAIQNEQARLCLCISDSDVKYPGGPLGDTARSLRSLDDSDKPLSEVYVLEVRELENLIALDLLIGAVGSAAHLQSGVAVLRSLLVADAGSLAHFDIKSGLRVGKIRLAEEGDPHRLYWTALLDNLRQQGHECDLVCSNHTACVNHAECTCILLPGLGPRIGRQVLEYAKEEKAEVVWQKLDPAVAGHWTRLGELIAAWCLGATSLPAM
jgi:hypothetical protein